MELLPSEFFGSRIIENLNQSSPNINKKDKLSDLDDEAVESDKEIDEMHKITLNMMKSG